MLRRRTRYRIGSALFLLLLVWVAAFGAWSGSHSQSPAPSAGEVASPDQQKGAAGQQPSADHERGTQKAPLVIELSNPPNGDTIAAELKKNREDQAAENRRLHVFTKLLILVGVLQFAALFFTVWVTNKLANASKAAAQATASMADSIRHAERAYLFFKVIKTGLDVDMSATVTPSDNGRLTYAFANMGRTPAILTEHFNETVFRPRRMGFPEPLDTSGALIGVNRFPPGVVVAANADHMFWENTIRMPLIYGKDWYGFAENTGDRDNLFLIGYIRYRDVFGTRYLRGYCAIFNVTGGDFVLIGNDRYNYEETES